MVDYAQLRNLDASRLTNAAETAGSLATSMSQRGSEVSSAAQIPPGMWEGDDASAASGTLSPLPALLFGISDEAHRSRSVLEILVEELRAAQEQLDDAHALAAGAGITISADGTVTTPVVHDEATAARNEELARTIRSMIDEAVNRANRADQVAVINLAANGGHMNRPPLSHQLADIFGPAFNGSLGRGSWATWAGQLGLTASEQAARYADHHGLENRWVTGARWAGRAGPGASIATAFAEQLAADHGRTDMGGVERGTRAAYRGLVQGGGSTAISVGIGALAGSVIPGPGTVGGAIAAGAVSMGGGGIGSVLTDRFVDATVDEVGNWAENTAQRIAENPRAFMPVVPTW